MHRFDWLSSITWELLLSLPYNNVSIKRSRNLKWAKIWFKIGAFWLKNESKRDHKCRTNISIWYLNVLVTLCVCSPEFKSLNEASLVYCCSASAWPLPDAAWVLEASGPLSVSAQFSLGSPSVWPSVDASGTLGDEWSEELSRASLSGDRGRQWSGMLSSGGGSAAGDESGNGPWYSGFCSYTAPSRPGKQMTAKYQWALTTQEVMVRSLK